MPARVQDCRQRAVQVLFALAASATLASVASGQQVGGLHLDEVSGALILEAESRDESRESFLARIEQEERSLREEIELRLLGDVYHERLVDFDLQLGLGLEQRSIDTTSGLRSRSVDSTNLEYNLRTRLLKEHAYSMLLYSLRTEQRTRQTFFDTTEAIVTESGAEVFARDWPIPSRLHYHHYDYHGRGLDTNEESRDNLILEGASPQSTARYDYSVEYNEVNLETFKRSFEDFNARASSSHSFGPTRRSHLFNSVRYREQTGDAQSENTNATSSLHMDWSESLQSEHLIEYDESSSEGAGGPVAETLRAESSLRHRLYESVDTTLGLRALETDFRNGSIERIGPYVDLAYRKLTFFGRMSLSYRADIFVQDEKNDGNPLVVLDEAKVIVLGQPIVLANSAVDELSIVVTDATGLVFYTLNLDYTVSTTLGQTRLDIPIGSSIVAGQTILVDYNYQPNPAQKFRSTNQSVGLDFRIVDHVNLSFGWGESSQDLKRGIDTGTLQSTRSRTARLAIDYEQQSVGAEYEDFDALFTPYERYSFSAGSLVDIADSAWLRVSASRFHTRFKGEVVRERGTTAGADFEYRLGPRSHFKMRAEFRRVDLRTDEGRGLLYEGQLTHSFRSTTLALRLRHTDEEFDIASNQRTTFILLTLSREF